MDPNPENTGGNSNVRIPVYEGSSAYTSPNEQQMYPGYGSTLPWEDGSGLQQLFQSLAQGGVGSIFPGSTGSDDQPGGPSGPITQDDLNELFGSLHSLMQVGGQTGNLGDPSSQGRQAIDTFLGGIAQQHDPGNPTHGAFQGQASRCLRAFRHRPTSRRTPGRLAMRF